MNRRRSSRSSGYNNHPAATFISILAAILIIVVAAFGYVILSPNNGPRDLLCKITHIKFFCRGIISVQPINVNGNTLYIGLSDGNYAFDNNGPDGSYKEQAVQELNNGNIDAAISDWQQAISVTSDDAEAMIYIENAKVAKSGVQYVTIVAATTLGQTVGSNGIADDTKTSLEVGQDDLRGIYLAQHDFNQKHNDLKVRVVVANLGVKAQNYLNSAENTALQQIIRLANTDSTFIGVAGFPFSAAAKLALPVLSAHHIPIVSPSASSIDFTNQPYFYRVIPSDAGQGKNAVQFASQILNAHTVAVFSDNTNPYSKSLSNSFTSSFNALGSGYTAIPESFQLSNADSLDAPLNNLSSQSSPVDMLYLAGYADDLSNLKAKLEANNLSFPIMGGDAFYEFGGYGKGDYSNFYFTAFTYPDIWTILCPNNTNCTSPAPDATDATQYAQTFDPKGIHRGDYGYERPGPHVWQSYDAATALFQAAEVAQANGQSLSLNSVSNALPNVSFQGTTGAISFSGSEPNNKTMVMLCIDSHYHTQLIGTYGDFARGATNLTFNINTIRQRCA